MARWTWLIVIAAMSARSEIVDRVAITVGKQVITTSDIERHLRLTAFVDNRAPEFDGAARRAAAEQLINEALIRQELAIGRFPARSQEDTDAWETSIRQMRYPEKSAWQSAIEAHGLTEPEVREHLQNVLQYLRFAEVRFGPALQYRPRDVRQFYENEIVPRFDRAAGETPPPFEEARVEAERLLVQSLTSQQLADLLESERKRIPIRYHQPELAPIPAPKESPEP